MLRISPEGRVFTLFDSAQREVHELALGAGGEIYALTVTDSATGAASNASAPVASTPSSTASDDSVTITIGDVQVIDSSSSMTASSTSGTTSSAGVKSVVYRIDQNGGADSLWGVS